MNTTVTILCDDLELLDLDTASMSTPTYLWTHISELYVMETWYGQSNATFNNCRIMIFHNMTIFTLSVHSLQTTPAVSQRASMEASHVLYTGWLIHGLRGGPPEDCLYPLTLLCASYFSASLVLTSNSQPDVSTLPPLEAELASSLVPLPA